MRISSGFSAVLFLALGYLAAGQKTVQVAPDGPVMHLTGKLTDFTGGPMAAVEIGITDAEGSVWEPLTETAADGSFEVSLRLQYGDYRLIAAIGEFQVDQWDLYWSSERGSEVHTERTVTTGRRADVLPSRTPPLGLLGAGKSGSATPMPTGESRGSSRSARMSARRPKSAQRELVSVFYATNRKMLNPKTGDFADDLNAEGMHYGISTVQIPPVHKPGELERPTIWRLERVADPGKHIVITATRVFKDASEFKQNLHEALQESGSEAFLFVHGYNVDFSDAVMRTAQLYRDLHFNGVPILFSWPAQSAWWRYGAAEDAVDPSALELHDVLRNLFQNEKLNAVTVIAHSMGNRILTQALDRLHVEHVEVAFKNIIMAAPDINASYFNRIAGEITASAKHTTIYCSSSDLALKVSKTFHSYQRLGEAPPVETYPGIDTIDASAIQQDLLGHSYVDDSAKVLNDLFLLVVKGLMPDQRSLELKAVSEQLRYWLIPGKR